MGATIGERVLNTNVEAGLIRVTLATSRDCGQSLILKVDNAEKTYAIEPLNLADPVSGVREIRTKVENLGEEVASFQDKTLLTVGISLIVLLSVLGFLTWQITQRLPRLIQSRSSQASNPVPSNMPGLTKQQFQRIEQQLSSLQELAEAHAANLTKQLGELKSAKPTATAPAQVAYRKASEEERREEEPRMVAAAASSSARHEQTRQKAKAERFEDLYLRLMREGNLSQLKEKNPIAVSFENQAAMDRNPEAGEPLVRNSQGWLMLFPYDDLEPDQYYVVPSLNFNGVWTETHRLAWRSVFHFASSETATLSQAAIATEIGGKWAIRMKGKFS